ncbi:type I restriction endonuclease subunit R [Corynebacterium marinum]|uniref:Type I restriction enzyme endonuclease subunit n=1 Tax=Corynebacterium marinum DSM 44953 TaxID=1224162 RepID=A0A0B6TE56_9CORY|nr:type I restriction endonuclease subunit R [Corynebacterium marinum]AJK68227.1 type i site-specific deoxyribonuclease, hsdr family [Corynebacterium marinum DSM 44953]GGO10118.1 DEAD/DEAH box helicase [Corynebacterium marinum]
MNSTPSQQPRQATDNVAESDYSTVLAEYEADQSRPRPTGKQSEAELEALFMDSLTQVGYTKATIRSEAELLDNLKAQLEALNHTVYTADEWTQIFHVHLANPTMTQAKRTALIQQDDPVVTITRDDDTQVNVKLIDKRNLMSNRLQVTNQYRTTTADNRNQRYDVTVLVNGLPMVHIELKRRGVSLKEAFTQISRYQQSFQAGTKLFGYAQLFVISNGTDTRYYSNTTRDLAVRANSASAKTRSQQADKSFAFTSYWADARNRVILDLLDFSQTFMVKATLLRILTRYCIFDTSENLLVMRPYQIAATERILDRIRATSNTKLLGTTDAGGYIWHTTGSGKTLTSFKAALLAADLPGIEKVIFAVDRQDLDYQTIKEYERFQKGSVSSNTSTKILGEQLEDEDEKSKIIVTTIQKLNTYISGKTKNARYPGHVVLIFDECHRSQFGSMHESIARYFKRRHSFGFTGTPIFKEIARKDVSGRVFTTDYVFGQRLHTYTIVDAIRDRNVLKFKIDAHSTMHEEVQNNPEIKSIDRESALLAPERITLVTKHILDNFARYTKRGKSYVHNLSFRDLATGETTRESRRVDGFNALLATASIPAARAYYHEFAKQQEELVNPIKVGVIYSQTQRQETVDTAAGAIEDDSFDVDSMNADDRADFAAAVADYNAMFGSSFQATTSGYDNYYKNLSERIRNREIDLVIVVNIFLTGFDAPALNTLFVDKNLRDHGLIQAFSRTNRILNPIKDAGMIVTYRDLSEQTDAALTMFGDGDVATNVSVVRPYKELLAEYLTYLDQLQAIAAPGASVYGEAAEQLFVETFSALLRHHNVLTSFEAFDEDNPLDEYDFADYISRYLEIRDRRREEREAESGDGGETDVDISADLEFEIELVRHIAVTLDYINALIEKERGRDGEIDDDEQQEVRRLIDASPHLRPKRDLILEFLDQVNGTGYDDSLVDYLHEKAEGEIRAMVAAHRLKTPNAHGFVAKCFQIGTVDAEGTALAELLPKMSLFSPGNDRQAAKQDVADAIDGLIQRFGDVINPDALRAMR